MYVPAAFAEADPAKLHAFIRRYSFAVLTSAGESGLVASHLPLLLDADAGPNGRLIGHMARANPQWRQVEGDVMAVFSGPHAYVSPSWYEESGTVPTWNYVAVHAYGTFEVVEEPDALMEILRRSVEAYESPRQAPWIFDESAPHVERMLGAIVGFRIEIARLEGKWKLSQNHPEGRRTRVIRALSEQSGEDSQAVAALMAESTMPVATGDRRELGMVIREPRGDDHSEWFRMRRALWDDCPDVDQVREMGAILDSDSEVVYFAERPDGGLCGFVEVALRSRADGCDSSPVGYIEGWHVDADMRRRGVGRSLFEAAESWARSRGCRQMASDAEHWNAVSQQAHRALGYEESARLVLFKKDMK